MKHPKRYMADGTATTQRVRGITPITCTNPAHVKCWEALTSWAGNTIPLRNPDWHIYLSKSGAICLLGPLVGRESSQFQTGLKQRVKNLTERTAP